MNYFVAETIERLICTGIGKNILKTLRLSYLVVVGVLLNIVKIIIMPLFCFLQKNKSKFFEIA